MRFPILALLLTSLSACAGLPVSEDAICDGTSNLRRTHAGDLLLDGGPRSQASGELLLTALQSGCAETITP